MKRNFRLLALLCVFLVACLSGCKSGTTKIDTPTTASNAGGAALVAYGVAGTVASEYFALPDCTTPVTALCKSPSLVRRLDELDKKAHAAAIEADAAVNDVAKQQKAASALANLKIVTNSDAVQSQIKKGGTP